VRISRLFNRLDLIHSFSSFQGFTQIKGTPVLLYNIDLELEEGEEANYLDINIFHNDVTASRTFLHIERMKYELWTER